MPRLATLLHRSSAAGITNAMLMTAISLSLRQLVDARTFRLMAMVTVLTLAIFVILGVLIWHFGSPWLVARLGGWVGPTEAAAMAVLVTVLIGWFMFRGVAMGVMGADDRQHRRIGGGGPLS